MLLSCESTGVSQEYKIKTITGSNTIRSILDNTNQDHQGQTEKDVNAIFCLYLYTYAELEINSLVDSNPSLDRVYVFDGKIMHATPFVSIDYI